MTTIKKYTILLMVAAAVIIELIGAVQYFMAEAGVERELLAKAERDMKESQRIATVRVQVQTAVHNVLSDVTNSLTNPEKFMRITAQLVANNKNIVGAGIAFKPNYFPGRGNHSLYAPYAYDINAEADLNVDRRGKPNVKCSELNFNYIKREWFIKPMGDGKPLWTQPYVDQGGSHILMCTYVEPIIEHGHPVGVFFADVPLKDISILSQDLHSGIRRSGLIVFALQLISFALLAFIIWRAVLASRRYKAQFVDPEKDHLIEQVQKLREINGRLTKRNQDLAAKVADLQRRVNISQANVDQHWFG